MTTTTAPPADAGKPRIPYREQIRAFRLVKGDRELVLDKRTIAFACQEITEPETQTVIGMKVRGAAPIVVRAPCNDVLDWWLGKDRPPTPPKAPASNGKAA